MNKKILLFFIFLIFYQFASCKPENPVILKLVVPSPADDWPLTWINNDFAERFNRRADKKYEIAVHPGGEIVKIPEYFNALRTGEVEMVCAPWGFYSFIEPSLGLIETPFLLNNQQAGAYAAKELLPLYDDILKKKLNQKGLGLMSLSGVELITARPVKTIKDWEGLLLGSLSPDTSQLAKALGGAPAVIDWVDFGKALDDKIIDGALNATHASIQTKLTNKCKYLTLFYGVNSWNGWSINLDIWKKMPEKYKQILLQEAEKSVDWIHATMLELDTDDLKKFKEAGVEIYLLPADERDRWAEKLLPYSNRQFSKFGNFGDQVKKIADEANSKYPYTGIVMN